MFPLLSAPAWPNQRPSSTHRMAFITPPILFDCCSTADSPDPAPLLPIAHPSPPRTRLPRSLPTAVQPVPCRRPHSRPHRRDPPPLHPSSPPSAAVAAIAHRRRRRSAAAPRLLPAAACPALRSINLIQKTVLSIVLPLMDKLLNFGRKAMFYVRVLSGYEERRIRSYRLLLQKQMQQKLARRDELRRLPETTILSEVRHMVEKMQALNRELENAEARIEEYFKPVDDQAEMVMNMQLRKEEEQMKEMMKVYQEQAALHKEMVEKQEAAKAVDANQPVQELASSLPEQEHPK